MITLYVRLSLIRTIIFLKHGRFRCSHCKNIIKTGVFTSNCTQGSFQMRYSTSCTSQNVIYLIECKCCYMQYIGQTNQQVSKRMTSHRFDINNYDDQGYAISIQIHIHLTTSDLFLSILSVIRWMVFVTKLINLLDS